MARISRKRFFRVAATIFIIALLAQFVLVLFAQLPAAHSGILTLLIPLLNVVLPVLVSIATSYVAALGYAFIEERPQEVRATPQNQVVDVNHDRRSTSKSIAAWQPTPIFIILTASIVAALYLADFLSNVMMASVDIIERAGGLQFTSEGYLLFQLFLNGFIVMFCELPALALPCVALVWQRARPSFALVAGAAATAIVLHSIVPLLFHVKTGFADPTQIETILHLPPTVSLDITLVVIVQLGGVALIAAILAIYVLAIMAVTRSIRNWQARRKTAIV